MWFQNKEQSPIVISVASQEKQILESLLNSIDDAVVFYDTNFKVSVFNKAAEDLFMLSADRIIGQKFTLEQARQSASKLLADVMFPSLAPVVVRQSAEGVYPQIIDLVLEEPRVELRISLNKVLDDNGQTIGFIKTIKDLTREKNLLQSQKDFITIAAHQLRTPATAVNWAFENLNQDSAIAPTSKDLINIGFMAGKNLMKIINDLLNITQIEEGRFGYNFQEINLVEFFDKLLADAEPIAKEYKVKVYLESPPEKVSVWADPVKLGIAVSNLIDNAIKYNTANGEVIVKIESMGEFAQVSIKDNGVGILEDELKNLFNKFFRGTNVNQTKVEGSGLGLYITKNVIERHGGKIWAESVINRGTTFYFTLPTELKLIPSR